MLSSKKCSFLHTKAFKMLIRALSVVIDRGKTTKDTIGGKTEQKTEKANYNVKSVSQCF